MSKDNKMKCKELIDGGPCGGTMKGGVAERAAAEIFRDTVDVKMVKGEDLSLKICVVFKTTDNEEEHYCAVQTKDYLKLISHIEQYYSTWNEHYEPEEDKHRHIWTKLLVANGDFIGYVPIKIINSFDEIQDLAEEMRGALDEAKEFWRNAG